MKEIKAIIHPHMLRGTSQALHATLPHFNGLTVSDCKGQGRGGGVDDPPPSEAVLDFAVKTKLGAVLPTTGRHVEPLVETIRAAAHTGRPGDGIIMVADLPLVLRTSAPANARRAPSDEVPASKKTRPRDAEAEAPRNVRHCPRRAARSLRRIHHGPRDVARGLRRVAESAPRCAGSLAALRGVCARSSHPSPRLPRPACRRHSLHAPRA